MSRTIYLHTKCGGQVDVKKRSCTKCHKVWNIVEFVVDPIGIRPVLIKDKISIKKRTYASWADKLPYVGVVAGILPNWPRWLRIIIFLLAFGIVYTLLYWAFGGFNNE